MLVLSTLHQILSQVLSLHRLHTAVLLTPTGQLISVASDPSRPKDEIRLLVGVCGEVWQETKDKDVGAVDCELGRVMVFPVDELYEPPMEGGPGDRQPMMLLGLNATDAIEWEELQTKGKTLAKHLAKPLGRYREYLTVRKPPALTATTSPTPAR